MEVLIPSNYHLAIGDNTTLHVPGPSNQEEEPIPRDMSLPISRRSQYHVTQPANPGPITANYRIFIALVSMQYICVL